MCDRDREYSCVTKKRVISVSLNFLAFDVSQTRYITDLCLEGKILQIVMSRVENVYGSMTSKRESFPESSLRRFPPIDKHYDFQFVILGGGISGCAAVHQLLKSGVPGQNIVLIEKADQLGGIARSSFLPHTGTKGREDLPVEYSWRVFGSDYYVVRRILSEIPDEEKLQDADEKRHVTYQRTPRTALQNWVGINDGFFTTLSNGKGEFVDASLKFFNRYTQMFRSKLTYGECLHLLNRFTLGFSSCRERRSNIFSRQTWAEFLAPLPEPAEPFVLRPIAPIFGIDMYSASASSVLEYLELWLSPKEKAFPHTMVSNRPTSAAWFTPWQLMFQKSGVTILFETQVMKLVTVDDDNHIYSTAINDVLSSSTSQSIALAQCINLKTKKSIDIRGKWFINCLTLDQVSKVVPTPIRNFFMKLAQHMNQDMVGLQLFFDQPICCDSHPLSAIIEVDSPWQLIIEPQGPLWSRDKNCEHRKDFIANRYGDGTIKEIWSVGLCDQHRRGLLVHKPWTQCTRQEIFDDVWHQISQSSAINERFRGLDGTPLRQMKPIRCYLWDSWQLINGKMQTWEPKTSPNSKTRQCRPTVITTDYTNLIHGGVWAQSPMEMQRMETAASNGTFAAEYVLTRENDRDGSNNKNGGMIYNLTNLPMNGIYRRDPPRALSWLFGPIRLIDRLFYEFGLDHPGNTLFCRQSLLFVIVFYVLILYAVVKIFLV